MRKIFKESLDIVWLACFGGLTGIVCYTYIKLLITGQKIHGTVTPHMLIPFIILNVYLFFRILHGKLRRAKALITARKDNAEQTEIGKSDGSTEALIAQIEQYINDGASSATLVGLFQPLIQEMAKAENQDSAKQIKLQTTLNNLTAAIGAAV